MLGSGVHQLLQSLFGVVPKKSGEVLFEGRPVEIARPRDAIRLGIGYVTEDRKNAGLLPAMSVLHNLTIIIIRALYVPAGPFHPRHGGGAQVRARSAGGWTSSWQAPASASSTSAAATSRRC